MRAAYDKYKNDGFVVISISVQEEPSKVTDFIAKYSLTYPFVLDTDGTIGSNYNIYTTPITYFITPEGIVQDIIPGVVSEFWIDGQMALVAES